MSARADLDRGWRLRGDAVPFSLPNAVRKDFYARVRPRGLAARTWRHELSVMLADAIVTRTAPDWVRRRDADAYLVAGDVVCPLRWIGDELRVVAVLRAPAGSSAGVSLLSPAGTSGPTAGAGEPPAGPDGEGTADD